MLSVSPTFYRLYSADAAGSKGSRSALLDSCISLSFLSMSSCAEALFLLASSSGSLASFYYLAVNERILSEFLLNLSIIRFAVISCACSLIVILFQSTSSDGPNYVF